MQKPPKQQRQIPLISC